MPNTNWGDFVPTMLTHGNVEKYAESLADAAKKKQDWYVKISQAG